MGIKSSNTDDWIFSFNIGNIMHLQALGFDDLEVLIPGSQFNKNETVIGSSQESVSPVI